VCDIFIIKDNKKTHENKVHTHLNSLHKHLDLKTRNEENVRINLTINRFTQSALLYKYTENQQAQTQLYITTQLNEWNKNGGLYLSN
jgi:hypothetical protein